MPKNTGRGSRVGHLPPPGCGYHPQGPVDSIKPVPPKGNGGVSTKKKSWWKILFERFSR